MACNIEAMRECRRPIIQWISTRLPKWRMSIGGRDSALRCPRRRLAIRKNGAFQTDARFSSSPITARDGEGRRSAPSLPTSEFEFNRIHAIEMLGRIVASAVVWRVPAPNTGHKDTSNSVWIPASGVGRECAPQFNCIIQCQNFGMTSFRSGWSEDIRIADG